MKILLTLLLALPASAQRAAPPVEDFFDNLQQVQDSLRRSRAAEPLAVELPLPTHEEALAQAIAATAAAGVPEAFVRQAFADSRVKVEQDILDRFKKPGESLSYEDYRKIFITPERIAAGKAFYADRKTVLGEVKSRLGVEPLVLTSLVGVETYYGRATGKFSVFNAFYTITRGLPSRSKWAASELAEYLKLCSREGVAPQDILGSYAGAFGYFQFLPSSFNSKAVDFDGDGLRRWDQWPDVLGSVANYLLKSGYKPDGGEAPGSPLYQALYSYNHSDNYVKVILELKAEISKGLPKKKRVK